LLGLNCGPHAAFAIAKQRQTTLYEKKDALNVDRKELCFHCVKKGAVAMGHHRAVQIYDLTKCMEGILKRSIRRNKFIEETAAASTTLFRVRAPCAAYHLGIQDGLFIIFFLCPREKDAQACAQRDADPHRDFHPRCERVEDQSKGNVQARQEIHDLPEYPVPRVELRLAVQPSQVLEPAH
jgi:hypothetical protein